MDGIERAVRADGIEDAAQLFCQLAVGGQSRHAELRHRSDRSPKGNVAVGARKVRTGSHIARHVLNLAGLKRRKALVDVVVGLLLGVDACARKRILRGGRHLHADSCRRKIGGAHAELTGVGFAKDRARILEDIAVLTGGQAALDELGVKVADITADMLGTAKSVTISKDNTVVVGGAGSKEAIDARIAQIKGEMENTTSDFDREKLQERLAKLSGGVAVIKVGAATESELKEIKHRIEDALQATRAAVEEGIVAGGGVAFLAASSALDGVEAADADEKIGVQIIRKALAAPVKKIADNAGFEGSVVAEKIKAMPAGQGLDSATGTYGDMIEMGVLDPVKVARVTLQNAASIAGLILITEATVSDEPKNTNIEDAIAAAAAQGGQGGGMY